MVIYGDGTAIRAWCYVSDCVDAVVYLLDHEDVECGAFNIGNPRATYSTVGLAYLVRHVTGQDVPIVFKEVERTEIKVRVPNIDKARRLLAYEPRVDLADGLRMTYEYFRRHA
jgi:nucleoside-diphosphate-sugar epimerase